MPKYVVTSRVSHGVTRMNKDGEVQYDPRTGFAVTDTKVYEPGDTIELTEEEATKIGHALEDAPVEEADTPELAAALDSIRRRPDHPNSGVTATWKVDAVTAAELKPHSDEVAQLNAEAADPTKTEQSKKPAKSTTPGSGEKGNPPSGTGAPSTSKK